MANITFTKGDKFKARDPRGGWAFGIVIGERRALVIAGKGVVQATSASGHRYPKMLCRFSTRMVIFLLRLTSRSTPLRTSSPSRSNRHRGGGGFDGRQAVRRE